MASSLLLFSIVLFLVFYTIITDNINKESIYLLNELFKYSIKIFVLTLLFIFVAAYCYATTPTNRKCLLLYCFVHHVKELLNSTER
jgi:hypothetical protein